MSSNLPSQDFLWHVFQNVDRDRSGGISAEELQSALSNGTWSPFNIETVKLMIGLFDKLGTGTVNFEQFGALWKYVTDWQSCFRRFDTDNSGSIDRGEFGTALQAFGYRLSQPLIDLLMKKFDSQKRGTIMFDDFIRCCVVLNMMTSAFREQDQDLDGIITIHYEQFLSMVLLSGVYRSSSLAFQAWNNIKRFDWLCDHMVLHSIERSYPKLEMPVLALEQF